TPLRGNWLVGMKFQRVRSSSLLSANTARARNSGVRLSMKAVAAVAIDEAAFCRATVMPPATAATVATATNTAVIRFIDMNLLLGDRRIVAQGRSARSRP